jgi:4-amino-4-deoxy-L-arabinose transferase-like glycosyltransferase
MTRAEKFSSSQTVSNSLAPSPRQFIALLLVYFALQTAIRTLISGTIDLDESEQLILTQKFALGYGSQPPLYAWLQIGFFNAFGTSVFALALLKNLLLFSIYLFTYLNGKILTRSRVCGMLAAISLLFIPQISWESQRDLTHSVLATAVVTATLFVCLRLRENSVRGYVALGICAALGMLSKYNYAAFLIGLFFAALTIETYRPLLLNKRIFISLAICLAILSPHLTWAFQHPDLLSETAYKFRPKHGNYFADVGLGFGNLCVAIIFHIAALVVMYAVVFRKKLFSKSNKSAVSKLFFRSYLFIFAGLVCAIFIFQLTGFKDRWFEPIFVSLPLVLVVLAQNHLTRARAKWLGAFASIVAILVLSIIPGRIIWAEKIGKPQLLNAPFAELKPDLEKIIPSDALIIGENKWVGGNLRLLFPNRNVVTPELAKFFSAKGRDCIVVWDATRHSVPTPALKNFVENFCGSPLKPAAAYLGRNYKFYRVKQFRLGLAQADNESTK